MSQSTKNNCVNTKRNIMDTTTATGMGGGTTPLSLVATTKGSIFGEEEGRVGSPRSVVALISPPTKRQKQQEGEVTTTTTKASGPVKRLCFDDDDEDEDEKVAVKLLLCILHFIVDDALTAHIFSFVGPRGTARCARVCKSWHSTSYSHPSLWRNFLEMDFGFLANHHHHHHQRAQSTLPWSNVYAFLAQQATKTPAKHLEASVVFADDGGNFPGYPAQHALVDNRNMVWCTSNGADRNVDLVVALKETCLLTGFRAANGGRGYSAPLQEGLVFVSMDPPNLEATSCYNIAAEHDNDGMGSAWVRHLFQPEKKRTTLPAITTPEEEEGNDGGDDDYEEQRPPALPLAEAGDDDDNNNNDGEQQDDNDNLNNDNNNNNNNNNIVPRQRPADAQLHRHHDDDEQRRQSTSPLTSANVPKPVAAFHFPDLATAYNANSEQTLARPLVGRYIHFKLLSSHSPPGLEHISDNIDLMNFHPMGIPLGGTPVDQVIAATATATASASATAASTTTTTTTTLPLPKYKRQHPVRRSRIDANPLDENGPWFEVDFF